MRTRTTTAGIVAALALALTACDDATKTDSAPPASTQETRSAPAPDSGTTKASSAQLPAFTGMGLQSAQDKAQELGFYTLTSHDALGRGRNQIADRNWKVCSQTPAPGMHSTDTKIDFGTVKLEESCPATDTSDNTPAAGDKMPNFAGKSVKVARQALDAATSLTVEDALPDGRMVLVESNWKVCTQTPAPGTALNGQPIALTAVKFEETCP
ncbi:MULTISPECIES: PASTA domain-containing protein [Streptomyces]|jgi:hypothetical protein|uniref:PASTA domain protein n=1 Tax=Streptomyces fradiae ATCC 10745 = DSM 40063 TaxID=1319510 RepID=A0A1Y2NP05_STRFR|nr:MULTISPECIES: PASTA domain-containing protein [Streptomyces]KAF0650299.1 hypothetical protein K701_09090 [Streptomyces fradiae ATCC 10745 = DSM 40063]OSY49233.1 PASTA domain protein [Streptomyces fradiae ATCC 10745 = DSM 40063]QEV12362.1 hypothetical protein CP974_10340 [Streptomyces fradiae ATCC 10745 = DSM 40063]